MDSQIFIDNPSSLLYSVLTLNKEAVMRHYRVEAARKEARALIEKTVKEVRAEMKEKMMKGEWSKVGELGAELVRLGETV